MCKGNSPVVRIRDHDIVTHSWCGMPAIGYSFDLEGAVQGECVMYTGHSGDKEAVIRDYHKRLGHIGPDALRLTLIKSGFIFPVDTVKRVVCSCNKCQHYKGNPVKSKHLIVSDHGNIDLSKVKFNVDISIDLKPIGTKGWYLFVIMCEQTRYLVIRWLKTKRPDVVKNVFREAWSDRFKYPTGYILYDGGNEWNSVIAFLASQHKGIDFRKTPKHTGYNNPRNERSHGPIMTMLKCALRDIGVSPMVKVVKPLS